MGLEAVAPNGVGCPKVEVPKELVGWDGVKAVGPEDDPKVGGAKAGGFLKTEEPNVVGSVPKLVVLAVGTFGVPKLKREGVAWGCLKVYPCTPWNTLLRGCLPSP